MDLTNYRLQVGDKLQSKHSGTKVRQLRLKPGEWFLKGPIPGDWLGKAALLPGKALHVALAVWHKSQLERSGVVSLSRGDAAKFGVAGGSLRRALGCLERGGLVDVDRHSGRSPRVTIISKRND